MSNLAKSARHCCSHLKGSERQRPFRHFELLYTMVVAKKKRRPLEQEAELFRNEHNLAQVAKVGQLICQIVEGKNDSYWHSAASLIR